MIRGVVFNSNLTLACFCSFFSYFICNGQFKVVEQGSQKPIPYATIKNVNTNYGEISDANGTFKINSGSVGTDTLLISCIGYEKRYLQLSNLIEHPIVVLSPSTSSLHQVNVTSKLGKHKVRRLGIAKASKKADQDKSKIGSNGMEKAIWIRNRYAQSGYLKTVNVYVTDLGFPQAHFRVHVYAADPFEIKPGKELTQSNIITGGSVGNEWVSVNLEKYHIEVPENGCFIGIEWFSTKASKSYTDTIFYKNEENQGDFVWIRKGNGATIGIKPVKYIKAKNTFWLRKGDNWESLTQMDESRFNVPLSIKNGRKYTMNEHNSYYFLPCIFMEVAFNGSKIKDDYTRTKNRKFNKFDRCKLDLFRYPQSSLRNLLTSVIKTLEDTNEVYLFKHLCAYQDNEQKEVMEELFENEEQDGRMISKTDQERIKGYFTDIINHLDDTVLTKVKPRHYTLTYANKTLFFYMFEGQWKINPYTHKIYKVVPQ